MERVKHSAARARTRSERSSRGVRDGSSSTINSPGPTCSRTRLLVCGASVHVCVSGSHAKGDLSERSDTARPHPSSLPPHSLLTHSLRPPHSLLTHSLLPPNSFFTSAPSTPPAARWAPQGACVTALDAIALASARVGKSIVWVISEDWRCHVETIVSSASASSSSTPSAMVPWDPTSLARVL